MAYPYSEDDDYDGTARDDYGRPHKVDAPRFGSMQRAREYLESLGLTKNSDVAQTEFNNYREYWWYGDGTDVLLDHSATITNIDGGYHISNFGRKDFLTIDLEETIDIIRQRFAENGSVNVTIDGANWKAL